MRGSVIEIIVAGITLFAFFVAAIFGYKIYTELQPAFSGTGTSIIAQGAVTQSFVAIDYGMAFLAFGLFAAMIISAFFIDTHPVIFLVSLILFIIVIAITPILSNTSMEIATAPSLEAQSANMPVSLHIVGNFPIIAAVLGGILLIALYAKMRS